MSPASMNARSSAMPPVNWRLRRSSPAAHWIENSSSSDTSASDEGGAGPPRRARGGGASGGPGRREGRRSGRRTACRDPRAPRGGGGDAEQRERAVGEEVG